MNASDIKSKITDWKPVLSILGGLSEIQLSGKHTSCPACGGTDRFRFDNKKGDGGHICNQCGAGDGIALLQKVNNLDFKETVSQVSQYLGDSPQQNSLPKNNAPQKLNTEKRLQQAKSIYENANDAVNDSSYIKRKLIISVPGLKQSIYKNEEQLILPLKNMDGELRDLQYIRISGKLFHPGLSPNGLFFGIGNKDAQQYILVEGLGTGISVHMAIPDAFVLVCCSDSNIPKVAKKLVDRFPNKKYLIAGDYEDKFANQAATILNCKIVFPESEQSKFNFDFNDLMIDNGIEEVKRQIMTALESGPISENTEFVQSPSQSSQSSQSAQLSHSSSSQNPPTSSQNENSSSHYEKLKDSKKAKVLSLELKNSLAWDDTNGEWYKCRKGIWSRISPKAAQRIINKKLSENYPSGYNLSFLNSITQFLQLYLFNELWNTDRNLLPLKNGVLNLKDKELHKYDADHKFTWQLPFEYKQNASCPTIKKWLWTTTNNDIEVVKTIQACFYLALSGTSDIQKFLEVLGPGSTGKSTLVRLLTALIGKENHIVTDLKNLENNRFESAIFYGKRLAVISDSSRYGGEVSMLKAISGGDPIRFEKKNKQQGESFVADCFIVIASNEAIQSSDYSSGMSRRRVPIMFEHRVTDLEKEKWRKLGGLEYLMHQELSGLLNWVLELSIEDVRVIMGGSNGEYTMAQKQHLIVTNKVAAWLEDRCILKSGFEIYIGGKPKKDDPRSQDKKLYPNYLDWCDESGVKPIALQRFGDTLDDLCQTLKFPVKRLKKDRYGRRFQGLSLRQIHDIELTPITKSSVCDEVLPSGDEAALN